MSALTKEELDELELLEKEEKDRLAAESLATKRQHLEALRLAKRLAAKHGVPGRDFLVLETKVGNFAIRRPIDVELDSPEGDTMDRAQQEKFATSLLLEPTAPELGALMAKHPGLAPALTLRSLEMVKVIREEEAKK